jgi:hypothetical protein
MPLLSRLHIRTALAWLAIGYAIGGLLLAQKGLPIAGWLWSLRYTHVHILLVGWAVHLATGVAFWILPRLDASGSRGDDRLIWAHYACLNAGVVLAALHDPLAGLAGAAGWPARAMLMLAGLLYLLRDPRLAADRRISGAAAPWQLEPR